VAHDIQHRPAHPRLNRTGGGSPFLFEIDHRLIPDAGASGLAKAPARLHIGS
jgi:hypothetical protein